MEKMKEEHIDKLHEAEKTYDKKLKDEKIRLEISGK